MANPNNILGISNPNGTVGVSIGTDPAGSNYAFSEGISSGFAIQPTNPAGMSVSVGGVAGVVDSALVKSTSGIVFPVANHSGQPVELEIPAAPSANSRIDAIVLSVDTSVTVSELNGADSVSIDVVEGDSAASPLVPDDAAIRASIPNGSSAAYIILGLITVTSSTSVITDAEITQGNYSTLKSHNIDYATSGGVWSTFCYGFGDIDSTEREVYTKLGTKLVLSIVNGGTGLSVLSGGERITRTRQTTDATFEKKVNGNIGCSPLKTNSSVWCRSYGSFQNGTATNTTATTFTTGNSNFTASAPLQGERSSISMVADFVRVGYTDGWIVHAKAHCRGVTASQTWTSEMTANRLGACPTIYQQGATTANVSSAKTVLSVFELTGNQINYP